MKKADRYPDLQEYTAFIFTVFSTRTLDKRDSLLQKVVNHLPTCTKLHLRKLNITTGECRSSLDRGNIGRQLVVGDVDGLAGLMAAH